MEKQQSFQEMVYSVERLTNLMAALGDDRSYYARYMHVQRAIDAGAFPGAFKLNPGGITSPWLIPVEEAEAWLSAEN